MEVILNTTFFYSQSVELEVRESLKQLWIPSCESSGIKAPLCLVMEPEPGVEGIERLAVQATFADRTAAETFFHEIAIPLATDLTAVFGERAFTCFSTIMEVIDL